MIRPVSLWVALRYLRAQRSNHFASFVAWASVIGVGLGVAALIVVLSVMNGFENELRQRLVAITGHGAVLTGDKVADWQAVLDDTRRWPGIVAAAPFVEVQGMIGHGSELAGAVIEGVDPALEQAFSGMPDALNPGVLAELRPGSWRAVLGQSLAARLGVVPGDRVRVLVPVRTAEGRVVSRLREFTVAGLFQVGIKDHDSVRVLVSLADAAVLAGLEGRVSGIRLQMADIFAAPAVLQAWVAHWTRTGAPRPDTTDWTVDNATYFRAVRIEKTMMTVLLSLIVAVAAFNIVATLVMVVTDKRPGIAILRTLGFSRGAVVAMFTLQGLLIGWAGVLAGIAGGTLLARNVGRIAPALERLFGFQFMPADVYYLTMLPSDVERADVLWVGAIALLMTGLATIYPALRAAAVAPAEVLRYE